VPRVSAALCSTVRRVSASDQPSGRRRVLVVEDDAMIRHLITVNLELEDFDVTFAEDGQACLDAVAKDRPHVIVLDGALPVLDGLTTTARLRADPRRPASRS